MAVYAAMRRGFCTSVPSFYYEYKFMKALIKNDILVAKKFNNTMRYIDDLLTLNNSRFEKEIENIHMN